MVGKIHSKWLRDKVVERHKSGGTTNTLPRSGRPSKLGDQARRTLIREAIKRPKATLKELQVFMVGTGRSVHVTTISQALHKAACMAGWQERSLF